MQWNNIAHGQIAVVQEKTGKKLRILMRRDLTELLTGLPRRATTT